MSAVRPARRETDETRKRDGQGVEEGGGSECTEACEGSARQAAAGGAGRGRGRRTGAVVYSKSSALFT